MSRCRASLAALLTGRWPHRNGVYYNMGPRRLEVDTALPKLLAEAGYATFLGGKFWEGDPERSGFDRHDTDRGTFVRESQESLFAFVDEHAGKSPMFIWWAPKLPHWPQDPPERYRALVARDEIPVPKYVRDFRREEYLDLEHASLAMVAWLDDGLAQLVAKLEESGARENTLFCYFIDNGHANGLPSKGSPFEKGLRTPVVFSLPGTVAEGARHDALVSSLDVYPTLLEYAGVPVPAEADGRSLRPWLEGRAGEAREALYGVIYPRQSPADTPPGEAAVAAYARTKRWKYVLYLRDVLVEDQRQETAWLATRILEWRRGDEDLYDLDADPYERRDLAEREDLAEIRRELRAGVVEWWRATGGGELPLPGE